MIVIDTSAIIAILEFEPERAALMDVIARNERRLISAVSFQEAGMVLVGRNGPDGMIDLTTFVASTQAEIVPFDAELARIAIAAFQRFGKGHHPRARLNFCDCSAYALAASLGAPLLYKGDDFAATDLEPAT